ncbi:hypothetical protein GALL_71070 [mine drainage metagenome]|uniref:TspB protein n=1 Tax=mine drainage metagenome TaxID=410659 RepID=A0A1J5SSH7_9ZZZZ
MLNNSIRRLGARVLLPVIALWFAIAPATSYAFVTSAVGGYGLPPTSITTFAPAASAPGAIDLFAAGALVAIGAAIGYFAVDYLVGGQTYTVRAPLTNSPTMQVPAPNAPATTSTTTQTCWIGNSNSGNTFGTQCVNGNLDAATSCAQLGGTLASPSWYCVLVPGVVYGVSFQHNTACPAGYVSNGSGGCNLSDARAATPDKACDLSRSGSALAMISDPDCAASGTAIPTICSSDGMSCVGYGTAPNGGAPRSYSIVNTPNGGSIVTTYQQRSLSGQTVVDTNTYTVSPQGTISSTSSSTSTGSIPDPSLSSAPAGTPASIAPTGGTAVTPSTSSGTGTITLPTDYARQGEAGAAADKIKTNDDARMGTAPTTEVIPSSSVPVTYTSVPFTSNAQCPADIPMSVDLNSVNFHHVYNISFSTMCGLMTTLRPLFLAAGAFSCAVIFIGGLKT